MTNVHQQVKTALRETLRLSHEVEVKENSLLKEELGLDSMSSLTFLMMLEENISGFTVDPDTLEGDDLLSVASISHYIESQLQLNTASAA